MCQDKHSRKGPIAILLLLTGCASQPGLESTAPSPRLDRPPVAPVRVGPGESIQRRREQAIAAYLNYLERYPASPERPQIERRVADLMLDSAAELAGKGGTSQGTAMPGTAPVSERLSAAIDIYEDLLRQDPQANQDTELLYQLGRAYEENAQPKRAMVIFERLIADNVASDQRLYADAQFRRGEILFGEKSFARAASAYRAVVRLGETVPVFEQALYKLGWSLFKQAKYVEALPFFFSLLDRKVPDHGSFDAYLDSLTSAEQEQVADTLRAISLCFSYLAGADSISAYFSRHGGRSYEQRIYRDLAALYESKELYTDAAVTYLALARRAPLERQASRLFVKSIRLYRQAGLGNKVLETQAALVSGYGLSSAFWKRRSPQACPEILQSLQSSLVDLARHYHQRAVTTRSAADYREAERRYRTYLAWFDDAEQAHEMHYQLAELLFEGGQYIAAATEFERIAYARTGHPQAAEAALSAIVAYTKSNAPSDAADAAIGSTRKTASAIRFAETYSDHPKAAAAFAQAGVELLERNQIGTAIRVCETLLQTAQPSYNALRQVAWSVLGQARFAQGDYAAAEQAYREALRLTKDSDTRRSELEKSVATTVYKQAEIRRTQGDARESALLFMRAAKAAPGTSVAVTAEYDAASALLTLEQWDEAIQVLKRFRATHPAHPLQKEATKKLAFAYHRSGRYSDAATLYLRLGTGPGDEKLRRAALVSAADLYQQGGNPTRAIQALAQYVRDFPRPAVEVIEVYRKLAEFETAQGDAGQHRYWLQKVIEADRSADAARNQRTRTLAAQSALALAEYEVASFRRVRLVEPLQDSLRRKLQAMRQALKMLETVTQYQIGPVNSAATYNIANLYRELSEAIRASERPTGLAPEELAQYERQLNEQAAGFEQKAIEIYQSHSRQMSAGRRDQWTELSLKRLSELQPSQPVEEEKGEPALGPPE
jgi:tetratricopeptide (TPR) repeat protein